MGGVCGCVGGGWSEALEGVVEVLVAEFEGGAVGSDVVHAVDVCAAVGGDEAHADGGKVGGFGGGGVSYEFSEEAFAREPHQEGHFVYAQFFHSVDEGEVVCGVFAKADARIQTEAAALDAAGFCGLYALGEEVVYFFDDVKVGWVGVQALGIVPQVHDDDAAGVLGADFYHGRVGKSGDIVDDVCPGFEGEAGGGGMPRVDRDAQFAVFFSECADDGDDAVLLFFRFYGFCAGAGGFSADINDVGAFFNELRGVGEGGFRGVVQAAIGEGVRGDVEDAHDGSHFR